MSILQRWLISYSCLPLVNIIELLANGQGELSFSELSSSLNIPKLLLSGLLFNLKQRDYVSRNSVTKKYQLPELIGVALNHRGDDTFVVVVGDHGHELYCKTFFINNLLIKEGLLVANKDPEGNFQIEWSKSKAFATGHLSIFINLKGRETQGIENQEKNTRN